MGKGKGKGKRPSDPADLAAQRGRTNRNKVKKYNALIESDPNNPHRKTWEKKREVARMI